MDDAKAVVPDLSGIPERDLVERAIAKRKPFKKNSDAGYRDTLIWHNVLSLAHEGDVILITDNLNDFAADQGEITLAADLGDDLVGAGLEPNRVELLRDTGAFVRPHVPESAQVRQKAQERVAITDGTPGDDLEKLLREALVAHHPTFVIPGVRETGVDELGLPESAEESNVTIDEVENIRQVSIRDARTDGGKP